MHRLIPLFLLGAGAIACGDRTPPTAAPLVVYTPVERARSDSSVQLTAAYSMDVDRNGNIYVADRWTIRVFGPNGGLLRSIGRQGQGPGEFDVLASVGLMPGDSIYAFDAGNSRATIFEPVTWRPAYTVQVGREQRFSPFEVHRVRQGRALLARFDAAYSEGDGRAKNTRRLSVLRLLNADGSLSRDSVLAVPERENLILHDPEGVSVNPFGRGMNFALASRDRLVAAWSDSLRFDLYSVDGRHLQTVRPAWEPRRRPITAAERDSVVDDLADELVPATSIRRAVDEHGATTWPLVQGMIVDDHDRVWMGITGGRGEPHHWMAFGMDGARVAQLDLPVNARLRLVRGNTAYTVELDDDDVPYVVVYDLKPTPNLASRR